VDLKKTKKQKFEALICLFLSIKFGLDAQKPCEFIFSTSLFWMSLFFIDK
jgi:hypothetical protein